MANSTGTLIFVDIDGVLNVGVVDPIHGGLLALSRNNVERAQQKRVSSAVGASIGIADSLLGVHSSAVGGSEGATFAKFLLNPETGVSDELVARLARLIEAAERPTVVLSSAWRQPKHSARVQRLEAAIGECLGRAFHFDACTEGEEDYSPEGRLKAIGNFITTFSRRRRSGGLRALVLEDFHATAFGAWACDGSLMASAMAAEWYLQRCSAVPAAASIKIIHTYDEWTADRGLEVQAGTGITADLLQDALDFLSSQRAQMPRLDFLPCGVEEVEFEDALEPRWQSQWPEVLQMLSCM
uniref:Uncharacterized protein n=1 Tax=Strombidinopsis acuminata TaxID=141414 RepID=A0A7S3TGC5_9SPIT|mmetsp:Transcript_9155/g.23733  ORF Transcript_9155/g.23733 Transcript_9155/m.23733 type:complete len:298 (-) Transcript_9155:262-1155(-)